MKLILSLLIKFGGRRHLERLLKEGFLHCNSIKWFAEYEDGRIRGDNFESVIRLEYMENAIMEIREANNPKAEWKKLNVQKTLYKEYHKEPLGNLFCISKLPVDEGVFIIDKRFQEFGGYMLLIHNQVEFLKRMDSTLTNMGLDFCRGDVAYLNLHTYSGEKGLYQKDLEYLFQKEYRVHIHRNFSDLFEFSIGNIEDIAVLYNCEEVQSFLIRKDGDHYECAPVSIRD